MARSPWRPTARPLPHLDAGCQTVPEGMVFLASQAPKSLDGRYLGMTPVATLTAQCNTRTDLERVMDHSLTRLGMRQRLAQVFLWLLGGRQTRDQYRQSASCAARWRAARAP